MRALFICNERTFSWNFLVSVILPNELIEPAEDFVVPLETVSVVQNPVVLIREDNQTAGDTSPTSHD